MGSEVYVEHIVYRTYIIVYTHTVWSIGYLTRREKQNVYEPAAAAVAAAVDAKLDQRAAT